MCVCVCVCERERERDRERQRERETRVSSFAHPPLNLIYGLSEKKELLLF